MKKLFVLFGAVVLVVAFTAPSFAAEWSFYGSARMAMFWSSRDLGDDLDANDEDTDSDLLQSLQGNSRIGANVKAGDNLVGRFEYGTGVNLRLLYGEYDFGGFKLLVGQAYTPVNYFLSNQVFGGDAGLLNTGGIYDGRRGMVQMKIGGFKFALVNPQTSIVVIDSETGAELEYPEGHEDAEDPIEFETDISWPKLEASWAFNFGGFSGKVMGGFNQYKVKSPDAGGSGETIASHILGLGLKWDIGPFFVGADGWTGNNVQNFGMWTGGQGGAGWDSVDFKVRDNAAWGYIFVAGFKMSDMLSFEGGLGQAKYSMEDTKYDDDVSAWYIQANIGLAKGVFIVPEIGQIDAGKDLTGEDEGINTYYGLKWQINF